MESSGKTSKRQAHKRFQFMGQDTVGEEILWTLFAIAAFSERWAALLAPYPFGAVHPECMKKLNIMRLRAIIAGMPSFGQIEEELDGTVKGSENNLKAEQVLLLYTVLCKSNTPKLRNLSGLEYADKFVLEVAALAEQPLLILEVMQPPIEMNFKCQTEGSRLAYYAAEPYEVYAILHVSISKAKQPSGRVQLCKHLKDALDRAPISGSLGNSHYGQLIKCVIAYEYYPDATQVYEYISGDVTLVDAYNLDVLVPKYLFWMGYNNGIMHYAWSRNLLSFLWRHRRVLMWYLWVGALGATLIFAQDKVDYMFYWTLSSFEKAYDKCTVRCAPFCEVLAAHLMNYMGKIPKLALWHKIIRRK